MNYLGMMYRDGLGCQKDSEKAIELFKKSAKMKDYNAMYNLGVAYAEGVIIKENRELAKYWLERAKTAGNKNAPIALKKYQFD